MATPIPRPDTPKVARAWSALIVGTLSSSSAASAHNPPGAPRYWSWLLGEIWTEVLDAARDGGAAGDEVVELHDHELRVVRRRRGERVHEPRRDGGAARHPARLATARCHHGPSDHHDPRPARPHSDLPP